LQCVIEKCPDGWFVFISGHQTKGPYSTETAAKAAGDMFMVRLMAARLARVCLLEPDTRWNLIRVAIDAIGAHTIKVLVPESTVNARLQQENAIRLLSGISASDERQPARANMASRTTALDRYLSLFVEFINLDWEHSWQQLRSDTHDLLAASISLLANAQSASEAAFAIRHLTKIYGCANDSEEVGARERVATFAEMHGLLRRRPCGTHIGLLSAAVEYQLIDLTSRPVIEAQLREALACHSDDIHDQIDEQIESLRQCATNIASLKSISHWLPGGKSLRDLLMYFLGFGIVARFEDSDLRTIGSYLKPLPKPLSRSAQDSKLIHYANYEFLISPIRRSLPISAGILPSQGQTRKVGGHRE